MSRRTTLGASASERTLDARKSLAPAPSNSHSSKGAATSRQSMAPQQSTQGRMSMAPRQSMGGANLSRGADSARNSFGSRAGAADRKSGGGRRSSVGANASRSGVRADPRPITDKVFVRDNIRKIIVFLTSHHYDHQLSPKQLMSPSAKDFRNILLFLFQQLDRNFQFPAQPSFEEAVKNYMKRFGYPFAISKAALQAAGSPHTWPSLLAMLVWFVEFLQYHETVHGSSTPSLDGTSSAQTPAQVLNESEARMFFDYASGAYLAFLQGEDNFAIFDENLAKKFEIKNAMVSEEIRKLTIKNTENEEAVARYNQTLQALADYTAFKKACQQDIPVLEENIRNNQAYLESVVAKKAARVAELEARAGVLAAAEAERIELADALSKQVFTPLQVQEMMHQKSTLESSLEAQAKQQENLQQELWNKQMEAAKITTEIEKATNEFNELSHSLAAASAKSAHPFIHADLTFISSADTAAGMLSLDLKERRDAVQGLKDSLSAQRKEASQEHKRRADAIAALQEAVAEREGAVELLGKRLQRIGDLYAQERAKKNAQVDASCLAVEDVELDIVKLRNALAALAVEGVQAAQAAALDADIARAAAATQADEAALKSEICAMMQDLTEHKVAVGERLEQMCAQADQIRASIKSIEPAAIVEAAQAAAETQ